MSTKKTPSAHELSAAQSAELLKVLKTRFEKNMPRHMGVEWAKVEAKLQANPIKMGSLHQMEKTEGEPDVVGHDHKTDEYLFVDCCEQSPKGRRSLCYDRAAWDSRKENKPSGNAMDMAETMGVELLTEDEFRSLQQLGHFDSKTSSWLKTPAGIRTHGGAIFGDFRFGTVFIYCNGAESYYAARGFRGSLRV
jgi:Protein of unknown function (DUF4256)